MPILSGCGCKGCEDALRKFVGNVGTMRMYFYVTTDFLEDGTPVCWYDVGMYVGDVRRTMSVTLVGSVVRKVVGRWPRR